jgi:uncharacterized protein (DUF1778 family)
MAISYKNPRLLAAALIVIIVVIGWLVLKKPGQKALAPTTNNNAQEIIATENPTISTAKSWEGILKLSDNPQKGNLMLQTKERTIYIQTSRDFSTLIDKEVAATYDGSLESFVLGDIKAK